MKKITKKKAMEMLNGKVQLLGLYMVTVECLNEYLINNFNKVIIPFLNKEEIRTCVKQSQTQIKFQKSDGSYTYLTSMTNNEWYLSVINNEKFIVIKDEYDYLLCYHIVED